MNKNYSSPELNIRPLSEDILTGSECQIDGGGLEDELEDEEADA